MEGYQERNTDWPEKGNHSNRILSDRRGVVTWRRSDTDVSLSRPLVGKKRMFKQQYRRNVYNHYVDRNRW